MGSLRGTPTTLPRERTVEHTSRRTPLPFPPDRARLALVRHTAWNEAWDALLAHAATPATVLLVGPPGTGKSAMLRELATYLRSCGRTATLVTQGDLPVEPVDTGVILVDETLRMPAPALGHLLARRCGFAVLTDVDRLASKATGVAVVTLRPMREDEVRAFAAKWVASSRPEATLAPDTVARLTLHTGGAVRLLLQLLGAAAVAAASEGEMVITGADIDQVAGMRQSWRLAPEAPTSVPPFTPLPPLHHSRTGARRLRPLAMGVALAACVVLTWAVRPAAPPMIGTPLPPLRLAELSSPTPLAPPPPDQSGAAAVQMAAVAPPVRATPPAVDTAVPSPAPAANSRSDAGIEVADLPPTPVVNRSATVGVQAMPPRQAMLAATVPLARSEAPRPTRRAGGPGIVLLAQQGDTLESLYNDLYRDRSAPPYADVMAVNPRPIQPGAIVVFPEPLGGWSSVQR